MKTKILLLFIILIALLACNSSKPESINNDDSFSVHIKGKIDTLYKTKTYNKLLYLNKTDADTLNPIVNDTIILLDEFEIPYTDFIKKTYRDETKGISEEQIITNRKYFFENDTVSVSFTNYCTDWVGLDSLITVFIFPDGNLGLIAIDMYSPGTIGACGGSYYAKFEIFEYNKQYKLKLLTSVDFDGCMGELIIDNKNYGKEQHIEKVYWIKNCKTLIFDTTEDLLYQFNIDTKTWGK